MRRILSPELHWLWTQARQLRELYLTQLCLVAVASLLGIIDPLVIKWLIDDILPWRNTSMIFVAAGVYFVVLVTNYGFNILGFWLDTYTGQRLMLGIRLRLLKHLQSLSPGYFLKTPSGELLHRVEQDVQQISELGGNTLAAMLRILIMTGLTLVILAFLDWRLTLAVVPLVPVMLFLRQMGYPRLRRASDEAQATNAKRVGFFQDHLTSMPQIQLLGRTVGERRRFLGVARGAVEATVRRRSIELALEYAVNLTAVLGSVLVLGYGSFRVVNGALTIGGLVAFYTYLSRIFGPTQVLVTLYSAVQRSSASIRRVMKVLESRPTIVDPARPVRLSGRGPLAVDLQDVCFSYTAENTVLDGLSLEIRPGEKLALVGASGCGKSTLTRLLTRMDDPDAGSVQIGGVDVRDVELRHLRQEVALVLQDPVLFDVSLHENLLYANRNATDHQVREALAVAQLQETVAGLPDGWSEVLGARGGRLSGGQRQRLAVARAILQQPRLLILDEATSALDGLTERRLLDALDGAVQDRMTTILVAHRLSAILWADRIVLLDRGQVVDQGTHAELQHRSAAYRELCETQLEADDQTPVDLVSRRRDLARLQAG